jgi:hypothetical protein
MRAKVGTGMPRDIAMAAATGAATATAMKAMPRSQPPTPRLSVAALATVQGAPIPPARALAAMPASTGVGRSATFRPAKAPANTRTASAMPAAICHGQEG